jgi:hypothetical protein
MQNGIKEKLIGYCGFDCTGCEARIAAVTNDNALRAKLANEWMIRYNVPSLTPGMIDCAGCRETGKINIRCELCEIRKCARSKKYQTCGECELLETCALVQKVHRYVPDAFVNLQSSK